ncbi:cytochrome c oxidase assembly factor 1 homolog [Xenentodon cancila]
MRVSINQLQKLALFTTVLTGGGSATMYCLMQKKFAESDYHILAVRQLEDCPLAMDGLGAPPLKVHNIHLLDRSNRIDQHSAQIKIPVTGSKTGGYLYAFSVREADASEWRLQQAVLKLREGQMVDLLDPRPAAAQSRPEEE